MLHCIGCCQPLTDIESLTCVLLCNPLVTTLLLELVLPFDVLPAVAMPWYAKGMLVVDASAWWHTFPTIRSYGSILIPHAIIIAVPLCSLALPKRRGLRCFMG